MFAGVCQELLREEPAESGGRRSQPDGRRSSLSENARKQRKRKSDAAKLKVGGRCWFGARVGASGIRG